MTRDRSKERLSKLKEYKPFHDKNLRSKLVRLHETKTEQMIMKPVVKYVYNK